MILNKNLTIYSDINKGRILNQKNNEIIASFFLSHINLETSFEGFEYFFSQSRQAELIDVSVCIVLQRLMLQELNRLSQKSERLGLHPVIFAAFDERSSGNILEE